MTNDVAVYVMKINESICSSLRSILLKTITNHISFQLTTITFKNWRQQQGGQVVCVTLCDVVYPLSMHVF